MTDHPACGENRSRLPFRYCESEHAAKPAWVGRTEWFETNTMGSKFNPHLHVMCETCGFVFLMEVADRETALKMRG